MMKLKKIGALVLAIMMIAAVGTAFAVANLGGTETGVAGTWTTADSPITQDKTIKIKKEITVFNPDEALIYGPEIQYTYTVAGATETELVTITDETTDHASGLATTTTALSGVVDSLSVTGDGSASGTPKIVWTNADILDASASGTPNYKNLTIDFTGVIFTQPGVYRYKITEEADAYTTSGVTKGTSTDVRFLDVYVMRSDTYNTGATASEWTIYGYVCIDSSYDDDDVTSTTKKTSGFVAKSEDETGSGTTTADQYHTYNLTVGKTLVSDPTMNSHKFPFDVAFSNGTAGTATETFQFAEKVTGSPTITKTDNAATTSVNGTTVAAAALPKVGSADAVTTEGKDGNPAIANGQKIKYIGIPNTIKATVTETNDVAGTTYATTATEKIGSGSATPIAWTDGTSAKSTDKKTATMSPDRNTAIYTQGSAPAADSNVEIEVTNTLSIISPTGVVLRVAPYLLMLAAGIALVVILVARRRKNTADED